MFTITNNRKVGDNSFTTTKGKPVTLRPQYSLQFEDDEINDGILRTMIGKGSHYKVLADTAEAQEMIDKAGERKSKKNGSPIVHGSTEPPNFQAGRDRPLEIRDLKGSKAERASQPGDEQPEKEEEPEIKRVFIQEEVKEKSPLEKLIEVAADKPYAELVAEAKEVLGDKFPEGRPGRPAIIKALNEMKAAE